MNNRETSLLTLFGVVTLVDSHAICNICNKRTSVYSNKDTGRSFCLGCCSFIGYRALNEEENYIYEKYYKTKQIPEQKLKPLAGNIHEVITLNGFLSRRSLLETYYYYNVKGTCDYCNSTDVTWCSPEVNYCERCIVIMGAREPTKEESDVAYNVIWFHKNGDSKLKIEKLVFDKSLFK